MEPEVTLQPYTIFKGVHYNEDAFVLGAGPSLLECFEHPEFANIYEKVVVSVNSSFILMPWHEESDKNRYWISNDALCRWWSYWPSLVRAKANRIVRNSWSKHYAEIPDFYYFWPRPTNEGICNAEDEGLAYCSSVPSALDLCIQMGCKRVFLLGVDHYKKQGKTHFWQFLPEERQPRRIDRKMAGWHEQQKAFEYNDLAYPALKKLADEKEVEVFNCSIDSVVDVFKKISFSQALKKIV
jgi:hypothetical protein